MGNAIENTIEKASGKPVARGMVETGLFSVEIGCLPVVLGLFTVVSGLFFRACQSRLFPQQNRAMERNEYHEALCPLLYAPCYN